MARLTRNLEESHQLHDEAMVDQIELEQHMAARSSGGRAESAETTSEDTSEGGSSESGDSCETALAKVVARAAESRKGIIVLGEIKSNAAAATAEVLAAILEREHSRHEDLVAEQVQLEEQLNNENESG